MTQDVDSDTYYAVGNRLFELAGDVYNAFAVNVRILGDTGAMAGIRRRPCGARVVGAGHRAGVLYDDL